MTYYDSADSSIPNCNIKTIFYHQICTVIIQTFCDQSETMSFSDDPPLPSKVCISMILD